MKLIAIDQQGCILKPFHISDLSLTKIIPTFLFMSENIHTRCTPLTYLAVVSKKN